MQNPKFETVQTFKTVDRLAMTDHQYLVWWSEHSSEHRCADLSTAGVDMTCERQGYLVRYQSGTDEEYYSWSPKEIMDAAIIPPVKTIEIELDPDDTNVVDTIHRIWEQFNSRFQMERSEARGVPIEGDRVAFYQNMVAEQIEALVRSIVSDRELKWGDLDIQRLIDTSWDKLTHPEHMRPNPTVEFGEDEERAVTTSVLDPNNLFHAKLIGYARDRERKLVNQFHTPLFQKAYDEFVRQAGVVSLPQALEAAIVVYTDGLTYSEE